MSQGSTRHTRLLSFIRERGYSTLPDLARAMGKNVGTLGNNLRYFSEHQNYKSKFSNELLDFLKVTVDELRSAISPEDLSADAQLFLRTSLPNAVDAMFERLDEANKDNYHLFSNIIDSLKTGDEVINIITNISLEFSDDVLQGKIAQAILRGVRFIYIYPNPNIYFELIHQSPIVIDGKDRHEPLQDAIWAAMTRVQPEIGTQLDPIDRPYFMDVVMPSYFVADNKYISTLHNYMVVRPAPKDEENTNSDMYREGYAFESSLVGSPVYPTASMSWAWSPLPSFLSRKLLRFTEELLTDSNVGIIQVSSQVQEFLRVAGLTGISRTLLSYNPEKS